MRASTLCLLVAPTLAMTGSATRPAFAETTLEAHSDAPAQLEERRPEGWRAVCALPCNASVDPRFRYRIGGDYQLSTPDFAVVADQHRIVDARVRPLGPRIAGIAFTGAGLLTIVAATLVAMRASIPEGDRPDGPTSKSTAVVLSFTLGGLATAMGVTLLSLGTSEVHVRAEPSIVLSSRVSLSARGLTFLHAQHAQCTPPTSHA